LHRNHILKAKFSFALALDRLPFLWKGCIEAIVNNPLQLWFGFSIYSKEVGVLILFLLGRLKVSLSLIWGELAQVGVLILTHNGGRPIVLVE